jgi:hypothetical protein
MTINDPRDDPAYQVGGEKYKSVVEKIAPTSSADAKTVERFHDKADTDASQTAIHHTLGTKNGNAAAGDHNHNGKNSVRILKGTTITGSRAGGAALISVIDALEKLGATDSTTA